MMLAPPHWASRSMIMSWILLPISWLYRVLILLRIAFVSPKQISVPLICVGNNTVGGAGKTPTTIALCEWLKKMGKTPHVISRGYKGQYNRPMLRVDPNIHTAVEVGDEPLLIARHAPCWVAKRRIYAANAAIEAGADIIIMDDGLQNPSLVKDCTIMVVDGSFGFGNRFMLPAGPCREPVSLSIRKSEIVLIIGAETNSSIRRVLGNKHPIFNAILTPSKDVNLVGKSVHPFAGIAHPDKFFDTVTALGGKITLESRFADHHYYTQQDLDRLEREASAHNAQLVTTEKDYVRLPESFKEQVIPIPVTLDLQNKVEFMALLEKQIIQ